ncbi:MAG: NADH-quinone oxidoreductase subunit N [Candidatus Thorarchaeota archaeon]
MQFEVFTDFLRSLFAPFVDLVVTYIPSEWMASLPALTLIAFAFLALIVGLRRSPLVLSFIGVFLAGVEMVLLESSTYGSSFGGLFVRDAFGDFFIWIILIVAVFVLLSSTTFGGNRGTYNFLLLISFAGAIWVVMATDLVALFVAWELMSTPTYVLAALGPHRGAIDGATKYFVMGLVSTTLMVFGIAIVYGATGVTNMALVADAISAVWTTVPTIAAEAYAILLAMVLFLISFGFKAATFPGWMWVPDTYSTADGSVTGYLAGATKKTAVSALLRILVVAFVVARLEWMPLIVAVAILTMIIGNTMALAQRNIMRMFAYSSIMVMGILFVGMSVGTQYGIAAAMFTAFAHALIKTGAFILTWAMAVRLGKEITYDDLAGLSRRSPGAAALLAILVFALAGAPFTAGFWFKWLLIPASAVEIGLWWLALIAVLNSVFALGYYLRVLRYCYFMEPNDDTTFRLARAPMLAVALAVIGTIALGIMPSLVLDYAFDAAALFAVP